MFFIKKIISNGSEIIEMHNDNSTSKTILSLNEGGRVRDLKLNNTPLIKEEKDFSYSKSYASSILFPFASRVEDGKYTYNERAYQLNCNELNKNALHGLIFNKKFNVVEKIEKKEYSSITLLYEEKQKDLGFPFFFNVQLCYTLFEIKITLSVKIINKDKNSFPFTLGWHPYFYCDNLQNSELNFKSDKRIVFDKNLITKSITDSELKENFKILDKKLDDCYILNTNKVEFKTRDYTLEISSNKEENYLQLYTPENYNLIAIEPMTGISNSFNNKIGLNILEPNQSYSIEWNCKVK